jgi:PIN domain nuclease of toxin-antitoxin system
MPGTLLDTHAALWLMNGDRLARESLSAIEAAGKNGSLFVSPISAWEIATLVRKGRIALTTSPEVWFGHMLATGVTLAAMAPDILMASVFLPGTPPNDPADRILIATARAENLTLITRDDQILQYAGLGHTRVLRC